MTMTPKDQAAPPHRLFTVARFAAKHDTFITQPALRNLILNAEDRFNSRGERIPGNGLLAAGAIVRLGRRVYIDEEKFFRWLAEQQRERRPAERSRVHYRPETHEAA
jgi:hypothetical protein